MPRQNVRHNLCSERKGILTWNLSRWDAIQIYVQIFSQLEHEENHMSSKVSKVMVTRSRGSSDKCWPISRERKVPETAKLVGRLRMPQTLMRTSFKMKRSKVEVTRSITTKTKSVSYLPNGKVYELQNWYADGACAISCHGQLYNGLWSWILDTRTGAYRVGRTRRPHNLY